jgi:hypothetical protein
MKAEIPPNDPRLIWQSQRREHSSMSVEEIRLRAYSLQTKIHRNLIVTIAVGFSLLVASAMMMVSHRATPTRLILAVLMVFIVVIINRAYRAFWSPDTLPDDATPSACLDFYRRELTAQHRSIAPTWRRELPEIASLILIVLFSFRATFRYPHISVLLPVFWALVLSGRYWKAHKINRELGTLDSFQKEDDDAHNTGR